MPRYALLATAHRWQATDVYQYSVELQVWNGSAYTRTSPAVTVVLPQQERVPKTQAVFSNLKQGKRYRAVVLAEGNAGGTAATQVLNAADTGNVATFDFTASQDVEEALSATASVTLDAVPFSGNVTVTPSNAPAGTDGFEADLQDADTGISLKRVTYAATQTTAFSDLRLDRHYQVVLTARQGSTVLATATSTTLSFDSAGQDLEQDQALTVTF